MARRGNKYGTEVNYRPSEEVQISDAQEERYQEKVKAGSENNDK